MRRNLKILVLMLLAALMTTGCVSKYKKIKISSFELESVVPTSMRSCNAVVVVGIDNPAPSFQIKEIEATLKRDGSVFGTVNGETVSVDAKCNRQYRIPLQAQLAEGVGIMQLYSAYRSFRPEDFTIDLHARAVLAGDIGKTIEYTDVPLTKFIKK